jgi:hypothetical protein
LPIVGRFGFVDIYDEVEGFQEEYLNGGNWVLDFDTKQATIIYCHGG